MLHDLDCRLIAFFDAIAGYLQERVGLTMALILREISMAMMFAFAFYVYAFAMNGNWSYIAIYVPFAYFAAHTVVRDYRKHSANAERDWTESLARKYLIEADKKRTVYGFQRFVFILLFAWFIVIMKLTGNSVLEMENLSILIQFAVFGMREYVTCAHPRPPGSRQSQGSFSFGGAR